MDPYELQTLNDPLQQVWQGNQRREGIVGEPLTMRPPHGATPPTMSIVRRPAGATADFDGLTLTPDRPGLWRLHATYDGGRREMRELVVFVPAVLEWGGLAKYPQYTTGSSARVAGGPRPDAERRGILRAAINSQSCSPSTIETALEQGPALCGGLNPSLHGRPNDGGLDLAPLGGG